MIKKKKNHYEVSKALNSINTSQCLWQRYLELKSPTPKLLNFIYIYVCVCVCVCVFGVRIFWLDNNIFFSEFLG